MRRIIFLTGTRADFGKIKSLLEILHEDNCFEVHIFITGMHMLSKYGYTCEEVEKSGFKNTYKYINQNYRDSMDTILAKTVVGFSDYVKELKPDMIVVHGDRVEALAGAIVGSFNNILVSHIEGGEVSGTIDELIRHSVSKLSHLHFVANAESRNRLIQLGEVESNIYVIGSPDFDVMASAELPEIEEVKRYYEIDFQRYGVVLFHPVTTEQNQIEEQAQQLVESIKESQLNFVVIYPNNDPGTEKILEAYNALKNSKKIKLFPSMRFEYFLVLMKNSLLVIGNSSAGVREAPFYSVPSVNIGSRQYNRAVSRSIINCRPVKEDIISAMDVAIKLESEKHDLFGEGHSAQLFFSLMKSGEIWKADKQKYFRDISIG